MQLKVLLQLRFIVLVQNSINSRNFRIITLQLTFVSCTTTMQQQSSVASCALLSQSALAILLVNKHFNKKNLPNNPRTCRTNGLCNCTHTRKQTQSAKRSGRRRHSQ